ncbi:hypothetical protein SZN_20637 [Streptomyces zinciresistens K42]|uniref:Uncharacterized protein n=1 Tax=Streptomyces zinciresistens K42 TaxID=700597 RepID=G2GF44_9ACTN|nr:hypothetical protein SZN_20637 [Streptomyces zinciresistens K42]
MEPEGRGTVAEPVAERLPVTAANKIHRAALGCRGAQVRRPGVVAAPGGAGLSQARRGRDLAHAEGPLAPTRGPSAWDEGGKALDTRGDTAQEQ